jgi:hypothetical protein
VKDGICSVRIEVRVWRNDFGSVNTEILYVRSGICSVKDEILVRKNDFYSVNIEILHVNNGIRVKYSLLLSPEI